MALTSSQIELLREIIAGKKLFGPKSGSDEDLNAFQFLAEEIVELCENGYITGCRPNRESQRGQIDLVFVAGTTALGRRIAQASPATNTTQTNADPHVPCPKCNHSLRVAAKYCDECGFSLASVNDSTLPM